MSKLTIDPSNIPGHTLAEIGRLVLTHGTTTTTNTKSQEKKISTDDSKWLDMRVEEMCKKGRI